MYVISGELREELDSRITNKSNNRLLLFKDEQSKRFTKQWFKGNSDIICLTFADIYRGGLRGLSYYRYDFADELTLMRIRNGILKAKLMEKVMGDENE